MSCGGHQLRHNARAGRRLRMLADHVVLAPERGAGRAAAAAAAAGGTAMSRNRALAERHRVVLGSWPICGAIAAGDPRAASVEALFAHVRAAGYDGVEQGVHFFRSLLPAGASDATVIGATRLAAAAAGVEVAGVLVSVADSGVVPAGVDRPSSVDPAQRVLAFDFADPALEAKLGAALRGDKALGCGYATFQLGLPPRHADTGGGYADDGAFLDLAAARVGALQRLCFGLGLNFYLETHIGTVTEDVLGCCGILERCAAAGLELELTGDLSHYIYRGIAKGAGLGRILGAVGHMHQRMARAHGDLSADVPEPAAAWADPASPPRLAWAMAGRALRGGLSSRAIMGETGPINLVGAGRVISDCHPSEGTSKNRTQIPIIHSFYLISAPSALG
jgi:sugar phosphate isomerase/epimerase